MILLYKKSMRPCMWGGAALKFLSKKRGLNKERRRGMGGEMWNELKK